MGKILDFEIFVSKYVSKHSESIPTKKNFDQKFSILPFFLDFWPKNHIFEVFGVKNFFSKKIFLRIVLKILLQKFQAIIDSCSIAH